MARALLRWASFTSLETSSRLPFVQLPRTLNPRATSLAFSSSTNAAAAAAASNYIHLSDEQLMAQCDMDTFKASGPGGQHRNKRESAVRLSHRPTGIVAQAVEERSQHKNRAMALTRLRTLLALKGNEASQVMKSTTSNNQYMSRLKRPSILSAYPWCFGGCTASPIVISNRGCATRLQMLIAIFVCCRRNDMPFSSRK
ncbi:uncharacterized protein LOC135581710 isoform X2 [Musa acuminata AAA Group]|uniref:uncharacterized protein LOC135581710 isoform X2 n=1 Tax=Musa acuminata AAA Group TaxID=214697 RepID=UPI0031D25F90